MSEAAADLICTADFRLISKCRGFPLRDLRIQTVRLHRGFGDGPELLGVGQHNLSSRVSPGCLQGVRPNFIQGVRPNFKLFLLSVSMGNGVTSTLASIDRPVT